MRGAGGEVLDRGLIYTTALPVALWKRDETYDRIDMPLFRINESGIDFIEIGDIWPVR